MKCELNKEEIKELELLIHGSFPLKTANRII